jgi:hypothetical protein
MIRAMMVEVICTSETSVNFNVTTRRYIAEDSKLHTLRRENLKSHYWNEYLDLREWKEQEHEVNYTQHPKETRTHFECL